MKGILRGSIQSYFTKVISMGFKGIFFLVVAAMLGPESFGEFSVIFMFFGIAYFMLLGFSMPVTGLVATGVKQRDMLFNAVVLFSAIAVSMVLLVSVFSGHISSAFRLGDGGIYLRMISLSFLFLVPFTVSKAITQGLGKIKKYNMIEVSQNGGNFIFILAFFFTVGVFLHNTVLCIILGSLTSAVVGFFIIWKLGVPFRRRLDYALLKNIFWLGMPISAAYLLETVLTDTMPVSFLGIFSTTAEIGFFKIAVNITILIYVIAHAVGVPSYPIMSRLWHKKKWEELRDTFMYSLKIFTLPTLLISALLMVFPEVLLGTFLPEYLPAAMPMRLVTVSMALLSCCVLFQFLFMSGKKNNLILKNYVLGSLVMLVSLAFLVPAFGVMGASLSLLASSAVMFIVFSVKCMQFFRGGAGK